MNDMRIMLVDDNVEFRREVREYLQRQENMRIAADCGTGLGPFACPLQEEGFSIEQVVTFKR